MSQPLSQPREGLPPLCDTVTDLQLVADALAQGHGPLAVDTERASSFRFDDRAFLVQLRREGAGSFLIDSERLRNHMAPLAEVINPLQWVLHAAMSDLPSLRELGLIPHSLFDTERAARLAGLSPVNLGAVTTMFTGYELAKTHGAEDWSRRPLPESWLNYAALDVEFLLPIARGVREVLAELGRLEWAEQEFEYIRREYAVKRRPTPHDDDGWTRIKGFGKLSNPTQLRVAQALWAERERRARKRDVSPHRIMTNDALITAARTNPTSARQLRSISRFPTDQSWWGVVNKAKKSQHSLGRAAEARPYRGGRSFPRGSRGSEAAELYNDLNEAVVELDQQFQFEHGLLIDPKLVRRLAWRIAGGDDQDRHAAAIWSFLAARGAREWQLEICVPAFAFILQSPLQADE